VVLQVALTFGLLLWAAWLRRQDIQSGAVKPAEITLRQPVWPVKTQQVLNAYQNQLEIPILFYLVSMLSLFTARASMTLVVLAWIFVFLRFLHALIHVTTNNFMRRGALFGLGVFVLILMWLIYSWSLFFGGPGPLEGLDVETLEGSTILAPP